MGCNGQDVIPGQYVVILARGYTLEQHQETIGIDLSSSMSLSRPGDTSLGPSYTADLEDATLAVVRKDVGVELVGCNIETSDSISFESTVPVQKLESFPV